MPCPDFFSAGFVINQACTAGDCIDILTESVWFVKSQAKIFQGKKRFHLRLQETEAKRRRERAKTLTLTGNTCSNTTTYKFCSSHSVMYLFSLSSCRTAFLASAPSLVWLSAPFSVSSQVQSWRGQACRRVRRDVLPPCQVPLDCVLALAL